MRKYLPNLFAVLLFFFFINSRAQTSFSHEVGGFFGIASFQTDMGLSTEFSAENQATMAFGLSYYLKFFGSQYNYDRIGLGLSTRKIWPAIGRTLFSIDAAKIFGKIPFPLLNIPLGNRSVFFNKRAFNYSLSPHHR